MPRMMPDSVLTTQDKSVVIPCPKPAKATIHDNRLQPQLSAVVTEAARQTYGKQENAARALEKDPGNFSRDIRAGRTTLAELAELGAPFLAVVGEQLVEQFGGAVKSAKERARERLPELIREILEATA